MIGKLKHETNAIMTQEMARRDLKEKGIVVTWFSNDGGMQSIVHSHPYYELVIPAAGSVLYSVMGRLYRLEEGGLILLPAGSYHSGIYSGKVPVSERIIAGIDSSLLDAAALSLRPEDGSSAEAPRIFPWITDVCILPAKKVQRWDIRGLLDRMALAADLDKERRDRIFLSQISELLLLMDRMLAGEYGERSAPDAGSALVQNVLQYIQLHYTEPGLTVEKIASVFFVSREYLSRVFRRYTLEGVHSYLTELRMEECRSLILKGVPIRDACAECGFGDYTSFLKTFRHMYGITPTEFRKTT